jgi:hypothetical protein
MAMIEIGVVCRMMFMRFPDVRNPRSDSVIAKKTRMAMKPRYTT